MSRVGHSLVASRPRVDVGRSHTADPESATRHLASAAGVLLGTLVGVLIGSAFASGLLLVYLST